ncbi:MAG TPA: glycosyl hydrolase [Opitutaceae bacterium]
MHHGRSWSLALLSLLLTASGGARLAADMGASAAVPTPTEKIGAAAPLNPVLEYLKSISGKSVVAGIHNREPNSRPSLQTDHLFEEINFRPALWSGDFLFKPDDVNARWAMIYECERQWKRGSIVQLMFHVAPPTMGEGCPWEGGIISHLSDDEWQDLINETGLLNKIWKKRLDEYAHYIDYLQKCGVIVLLRPFHEMNQRKFWWGGRPGPQGTGALYRLTHDYLTNVKGLKNIVWIWDMQDMSRDFADYNPGEEYWDLFAFDIYADGYDSSWYSYVTSIVPTKPIMIGECAHLPSPQVFATQPRWCAFMSWSELTFTENTREQLLEVYRAKNVITGDKLPHFVSP